jgi:hypothetical protein
MFNISDCDFSNDPFNIKFLDNELTNSSLKGSVYIKDSSDHPEWMSDDGQMSWELEVKKTHSWNVGYGSSWLLRALHAFEMYWHVEGLKSEYEGTVTIDGETYNVSFDTSYGYQDKNWGIDYTSPWIWLNSSCLTYKGSDEILMNTCFDFGGGKPVVFGKPLKGKILGVFVHEDKKYEYNFSKFWMFNKQQFNVWVGNEYIYWEITCSNLSSKIEISFKARKDELLKVNYENPEGLKLHDELWNGGTAFGTVKLYTRKKTTLVLTHEFEGKFGGCEFGEYKEK